MPASDDHDGELALAFLHVLRPRQHCLHIALSQISYRPIVLLAVHFESRMVQNSGHRDDTVVQSAFESFLGGDADLDTLLDPL